jgi:hypothetical protein
VKDDVKEMGLGVIRTHIDKRVAQTPGQRISTVERRRETGMEGQGGR